MLFFAFMLFRNQKVFKERMRVLDIISQYAKMDIRNQKDYDWRYKEFDTIPYNRMFYRFWIPVKEFFKEMDCIKPFRGQSHAQKEEPCTSQKQMK